MPKTKLIGRILLALAFAAVAPIAAAQNAGTAKGSESVAASLAGTAAAATPAAADPLGTLLTKLSSEHPADSARLQPLPAPDSSIDLWHPIRRGSAMPDLETRRAASSTRWYADKPDYFGRMAARGPTPFNVPAERASSPFEARGGCPCYHSCVRDWGRGCGPPDP